MSKFTVLTGELAHETNTFQSAFSNLTNFTDCTYVLDQSLINQRYEGTTSSLGGTILKSKEYLWDLRHNLSAVANPSGIIDNNTFEVLIQQLFQPIINGLHVDGIILHLHGAMVTELYEDAEGELLLRLNQILETNKQFEVPIIVTLDLHGNITEKMTKHCSCLIACRTYPHIDFYERALDGCDILQKCMLGQYNLQTIIQRGPMLKGLDGGRTQAGCPLTELIQRSEIIEKDETNNVIIISICAGFSAADIYDIGPSITVTLNVRDTPNIDFGVQKAKEFYQFIWDKRTYSSVNHLTIDAAIETALELQKNYIEVKKPLVMADVTDNPGSGHYGDSTNLLKAMINAKLSNALFYAIYDKEAASQCVSIGIGNSGHITLGGKHDANCGGAPLNLYGKVVTLSDGCFPSYGLMGGGVWANMGISVLFRVSYTDNSSDISSSSSNGSIDIMIISNNGQLLDLAQITSLGVDPLYKHTIAVKSNHHFRASLDPIARKIITLDGGGLGSMILKGGNYKNVRRPIWPIDDIELPLI